ncbi:hypothetical protein HZH68_005495 [Vespula germanica]|uniref:Uncharacterized protein n=1 Tax=Vespula germanica TaxID=30212 RepID=A0A834KLA7_VESGE|nr:hypothetical protein HZH68_005495 [Vespula germanica]
MFDRKKKTVMEYEPSCFGSRESIRVVVGKKKEGGTIFFDKGKEKKKEEKRKEGESGCGMRWGWCREKQTLGLNSSWNNPLYKLDRRRNVETEHAGGETG